MNAELYGVDIKGGNSKVIFSRVISPEVKGSLMKHWPGPIDDCEI
jgi:hypothetical protein